jgi:hypothetical protein
MPMPWSAAADVPPVRALVHLARLAVVLVALTPAAGCRDAIARKYEYEEDVYLRLDGAGTGRAA